ncbi:exonuclease domain-containing protein [Fictibacillus sp. WQ 8-8]|uniref:exonuclease domain-containing protein n=1 Tax=Fictibacillus sp. WQ 8-8 TaxID=2938788 RepID=UPI00210ACC76|nr:exonuclease domain-containing protein [Fictibacillus sp. WQ 8-8]MCQ6267222.1 exonuclease domain-containing protein [Fictibacillus sp. WQ 8-8]
MNNQPGSERNLKYIMHRLFNLGLNREEVPPGNPGSFQHEAWIRKILKEKASKRADLKTKLDDVLFIILDTETTGFRPEHGDQIFSIAAAKMKNSTIIEQYHQFINPSVKIPDEIRSLTGIIEDDVKNAPTLDKKAEEIFRFLSGGVIIGYHISHDVAFINHYLWKRYRSSLKQPSLELALITEKLVGSSAFPTLDSASSYFDIDCCNRHSAQGDVLIMVDLWRSLLDLSREKGIETLEDLYVYIK